MPEQFVKLMQERRFRDQPTSALLRDSIAQLGSEILSRLARAGFPDSRPGHGYVMGHLMGGQGIRLTKLAELARMTPQAMGELVDNLESLGYVERRPDPSDRRAKLICVAPKGRASGAAARAAVAEQEEKLRKLLGEADYRQLRALLARLIENYPTVSADHS